MDNFFYSQFELDLSFLAPDTWESLIYKIPRNYFKLGASSDNMY